jgi:hypothetical protein
VAIIYINITLTPSITIPSKLKFMHNPTLLSVTTPSMVRYEGKDPQPTEGAWPSCR